MQNKIKNMLKATMINIVVAFFVVIIILGSIQIVLGQKIDEAITMLNYITIDMSNKKETEIKLDENTRTN